VSNPFVHDKRKPRTARQYAEIFAAHDGRCHSCKRRLGPGDKWDLDHVIALAKGGSDDDDNLAPCCEPCHSLKTRDDVSETAAGKRNYVRHHVPGHVRRSRTWGRR